MKLKAGQTVFSSSGGERRSTDELERLRNAAYDLDRLET